MAKVYEKAKLFLSTKNDIFVYYGKFPTLGIYHSCFQIWKAIGPLSKKCKKSMIWFVENQHPFMPNRLLPCYS